MKRVLTDGLELDDDKTRIDRAEVHRFLCDESYWAAGRPRETQERLIDEAARVVGLYDGERQIGFCRAATDGVSFVYLADVYVLEEYRGRGLGESRVRACRTRRARAPQGLRTPRCSHALREARRRSNAKVMERLPLAARLQSPTSQRARLITA